MKGKLLVLWGLTGVALIGSVAMLILYAIKPGGVLTKEGLRAARTLWKEKGPKNYDMDLELSGSLKGKYAIQVRDAAVVKMTIDGREIEERTRRLWTVEGMFRFLQDDLDNLRFPKRAFGVDDADQVVLRAAWDKASGYPSFYLRHVTGQGRGVRWEVTRFETAD